MFCKNCGKQLNPRDNICRSCGTARINPIGGNGFWDIIKVDDNNNKPSYPAKVPNSASVSKKNTPWLKWAITLLFSLSLLCSIIAITTVFSLKRDVENYIHKVDTLSFSLSESESLLSELKDNISQLEASLDDICPEDDYDDAINADKSNENADSTIIITKQPSDERIPNGENRIAFTVIVSGSDCVFQWQREVQGVWNDIGYTQGYSSQEEYDSVSDSTKNLLKITNATNNMSGTYRCKIISNASNNTAYTSPVSLSIYQPPSSTVPISELILPDDNWGISASDTVSPANIPSASAPMPTPTSTPSTPAGTNNPSSVSAKPGLEAKPEADVTLPDTSKEGSGKETNG